TACPAADLIIDFSSDPGAAKAAIAARERGTPLLIATTALSEATKATIQEAAERAAVLVAANTSIGANLLADLAHRTAVAVESGTDAAIIESHHREKKDAPSGTALHLAAVLRGAGLPLADDQILSIRGGDVPGEHLVRFAWEGEVVELRHAVTSRDVFATGALRAGRWLVKQPPGWYMMKDLLAGLRQPSGGASTSERRAD
ncbi:MAG: 4-hydroxy-tetrahydrodipicolinate reductase, partial [Phycisphaerales bacterium JB038]